MHRLSSESAPDERPSPQQQHVARLVKAAPILADLSRADILVTVPDDSGGFRVIDHKRPINARTLYSEDPTGDRLERNHRPLMSMAFDSGTIVDGGQWLIDQERWIRTLAVPVRHGDEVIGVLSREFSPTVETNLGDLELTSFAVVRRLATMINDGTFPASAEVREHDHPPRVGDGLVLLNSAGEVEFASPNAVSVLRNLGHSKSLLGRRLTSMGIEPGGIRAAFDSQTTHTDSVETAKVAISLMCIPLTEVGRLTGALVLMRNITEIAERDRLLLTKDATIAEIHHRVKNNLQTVSSLLQLQGRRLTAPEGRKAIDESARRIRAISVVHEILSHRSGDEISFGEILRTLSQLVREALTQPANPVEFVIEADDSVLPSEVTTTLSVVVSELLQNTIDHAFDVGAEGPHVVTVRAFSANDELELSIRDNGGGLPPNFDIDRAEGLGLTIVRTLVETELRGTIAMRSEGVGCAAELRIPLFPV